MPGLEHLNHLLQSSGNVSQRPRKSYTYRALTLHSPKDHTMTFPHGEPEVGGNRRPQGFSQFDAERQMVQPQAASYWHVTSLGIPRPYLFVPERSPS